MTPQATETPAPSPTPTPPGGQQGVTQVVGTVPGLYGGTRSVSSCNKQMLIDFLVANQDKARAWATAEGITPDQIPAYIGGLTPVVLRSDTRVTNHGFTNGQADPYQSVLQAGTAVLVDAYGVPRARCYCGNPLTPPVPVATAPTYTGNPWPGFSPGTVTAVAPPTAPAPGNCLVLIDPATGKPFCRPLTTSGGSDTNVPPGLPTPAAASPTPSPPGAPSGDYVIKFVAPTLIGQGVNVTAAQCAKQFTSYPSTNITLIVNGTAATVFALASELIGTFDPATGAFNVTSKTFTRNDVLPTGDVVQATGAADSLTGQLTMKGTADGKGRISGTFVSAVTPPTEGCSFDFTGRNPSASPSPSLSTSTSTTSSTSPFTVTSTDTTSATPSATP
ncbi:MAG TPA: DUF6777 domain-containing protein [Candidatus Dormibacteraeota bacterium]|nr:DUF6777 domain-containing protein [Candidatus Dormibacteraeota bacterium]